MTPVNDDIAAIEAALPIITPEDRARYTEATQPARLRRVLDAIAALTAERDATAQLLEKSNAHSLDLQEALDAAVAEVARLREARSLSDGDIQWLLPAVRHREGMNGYQCYSFDDVAAAVLAALGGAHV